jgi:hypothetical protein
MLNSENSGLAEGYNLRPEKYAGRYRSKHQLQSVEEAFGKLDYAIEQLPLRLQQSDF